MRLSASFIFTLITCAVLCSSLIAAEKAVKTRRAGEKGLEGQKYEEKFPKKTAYAQHKNKNKYSSDESDEDSEESDDDEPRKNFRGKQKIASVKNSEEDAEVKKGRWNVNYRNHKNAHMNKDADAKFTTSFQSTKKTKKESEDDDSPGKESHNTVAKIKNEIKKKSVDKEGVKKYLKSKNAPKSHDDNDSDDDSSEETTAKKKQDDLKPFTKVRKSNPVRRERPRKVLIKDDDDDDDDKTDSDDTSESHTGTDDDSDENYDSSDDDSDVSKNKEHLQCDSLEDCHS